MSKMTHWQHLKENGLGTCIFLFGCFVVALILEIVRDSNVWWISFFFLALSAIIPIANYFSWKKKFGGKE